VSETAISAIVEYDDTVSVEPEQSINGSSASPYPALAETQRTRILDGLRERYSDAAVDAVLGAFWDWKLTSYANHARTHERLFRSVLDVRSSERNGDLVCRAPRGEEGTGARGLYELSQSFAARHFPERVPVYRGLEVSVPQLVVEMLDQPERKWFDVESPAVFVNFTTDEVIARSYGVLAVGGELPREAIGLTPDFVLPYVRGGHVSKRDAELRVRGDRLPAIHRSRIALPATGRPVANAFRTPEKLSDAEHDEVVDIVMRTATSDLGGEVTTQCGRRRLRRWLQEYRKRAGPDDRYRVQAVTEAVAGIIE